MPRQSDYAPVKMNDDLQRELLQRLRPLRELLDGEVSNRKGVKFHLMAINQALGEVSRASQSEGAPTRPESLVSVRFVYYLNLTGCR